MHTHAHTPPVSRRARGHTRSERPSQRGPAEGHGTQPRMPIMAAPADGRRGAVTPSAAAIRPVDAAFCSLSNVPSGWFQSQQVKAGATCQARSYRAPCPRARWAPCAVGSRDSRRRLTGRLWWVQRCPLRDPHGTRPGCRTGDCVGVRTSRGPGGPPRGCKERRRGPCALCAVGPTLAATGGAPTGARGLCASHDLQTSVRPRGSAGASRPGHVNTAGAGAREGVTGTYDVHGTGQIQSPCGLHRTPSGARVCVRAHVGMPCDV